MFNKKTRRNFRQRRDESSEEDESVKGDAQRSHARAAEAEAEDAARAIRTPQKEPLRSTALSFRDDRRDEDQFKLKRSANKAVVFQARKKEESPVKNTCPQGEGDVDLSKHSDSSASASAEDMASDSDDESNSTVSSSSNSTKEPPINIPDAKKIRAAKEQRRRARAQKDYIPLDGDRESTPGTGDGDEEQSDREQDTDSELDDHERRIQFAPKSKSLRERMAEKMGDSEESQSDSQEEEDQHLWEEQQIGKGVKRHQQQSRDHVRPLRQKKKFDIPDSLPPVSIDVIKRRITGRLEQLKEVHRAREAELRRMKLDIESARSTLENLENHATNEQLLFYRNMTVFSHNLVDCLSEKIVLVNTVELDMHTLYIDQTEALLSQRTEAVREESARLKQLTYSSNSNTETGGNTSPAKDSKDLEEDCRMFPPDLEPTAEQEEELQSKRADILKRSREIFADVQEDFSDVKKILSRFYEWQVSFPDSYANAYIGLCLPKLLAPIIRLQLIDWNPLRAEGEDFEALPWYSAVENFCHGQGYEESENADMKTLPAVIEKTILPKIQVFVEFAWDPFSSRQSQCLTALCKRIQEDYSVFEGEQSKPVKAFMEAVTQRLRSAVDNDIFIPIYPKTYLDDKTSPQFRFQTQQFWCAVKLLENMALWDGLLAPSVLKELMLDKLLNRYLMMTLLNESNPKHIIQKCQKVAECFPDSWFLDLSTRSSLPQLQNFSRHLLQTASLLSKDNKDPAGFRSGLSDLMNILWSIKEFESMKLLAEKHNCQDLLESFLKS